MKLILLISIFLNLAAQKEEMKFNVIKINFFKII